jgi:hypothetical protein
MFDLRSRAEFEVHLEYCIELATFPDSGLTMLKLLNVNNNCHMLPDDPPQLAPIA